MGDVNPVELIPSRKTVLKPRFLNKYSLSRTPSHRRSSCQVLPCNTRIHQASVSCTCQYDMPPCLTVCAVLRLQAFLTCIVEHAWTFVSGHPQEMASQSICYAGREPAWLCRDAEIVVYLAVIETRGHVCRRSMPF
jgi:hypothetical protein